MSKPCYLVGFGVVFGDMIIWCFLFGGKIEIFQGRRRPQGNINKKDIRLFLKDRDFSSNTLAARQAVDQENGRGHKGTLGKRGLSSYSEPTVTVFSLEGPACGKTKNT